MKISDYEKDNKIKHIFPSLGRLEEGVGGVVTSSHVLVTFSKSNAGGKQHFYIKTVNTARRYFRTTRSFIQTLRSDVLKSRRTAKITLFFK